MLFRDGVVVTEPSTAQNIIVPRHCHVVEPYAQASRGGSRDDRMLREVTAALPPMISDLDIAVPSSVTAELDLALWSIGALEETHGGRLGSLSTMLLRAESVASSKIEHVEASVDDYARALHGVRANPSATSMVASTRALDDLIRSTDPHRPIELDSILRAHATLMADDPAERHYAGRLRDVQNWIGGSDHSPRGALYVPPPPRTVDALMADLLQFSSRDDIGVLVQAAVAHAQFESIHPFTDGNGRIGRALINTILRRRGATRRVVVPLASAIVARRESYFDALGAYREGDAAPIVRSFARGAAIAASESRTTAARLATLPAEWRLAAGSPRRGSAASALLEVLVDHPVLSAEDAERLTGSATSSTYAAITRLHESGVIRPLTDRTRNQVWVATAIADELDDLGVRIAARARE